MSWNVFLLPLCIVKKDAYFLQQQDLSKRISGLLWSLTPHKGRTAQERGSSFCVLEGFVPPRVTDDLKWGP